MSEVRDKALLAKQASLQTSQLSSDSKNDAIQGMADMLLAGWESIVEANQEDLQRGKKQGTSDSLLDRLALNKKRIESIAEGLQLITELPDPIGEVLEESVRPNGLLIRKIRVPLGVIGMIYEARPNVTVDAAGLCLKTGNSVVLRGGSAAVSSNKKIVEIMHSALAKSAIPRNALQLIINPDRSSVDEMLKLNGLLDVVIPRGGHTLIQNVVQNATVPVIETGAGICHTFIDEGADAAKAAGIAINAKVQRPSVCNAMETLLVHRQFAEVHLLDICELFRDKHVELRGCGQAKTIAPWIKEASEADWGTEYNDYILNIKVVDSLDEAIAHIRKYGTMHSECIVTENQLHAESFMQEIDAAAVYHNASTRFTDGYEFGYGAEIGISTQKLHARGPMGLPSLTSTKYKIYGTGQIRT